MQINKVGGMLGECVVTKAQQEAFLKRHGWRVEPSAFGGVDWFAPGETPDWSLRGAVEVQLTRLAVARIARDGWEVSGGGKDYVMEVHGRVNGKKRYCSLSAALGHCLVAEAEGAK